MESEENIGQISSGVDNTYKMRTWMMDLLPKIFHLSLHQLSLPSAHNAGMDKDITYNDSYHACQDHQIRHQLDHGVRVLDLRFKWYAGYHTINEGMIAHHGGSGRTFGQIMLDIYKFQLEYPGEIIILDFHDLSPAYDVPVPYKLFYDAIVASYGKYLIPFSARDLSLAELKDKYPGPRMVFAVPSKVWSNPPEPLRDRTYFWDQIPHKWIGKDLANTSDVWQYIRANINNRPSPNYLSSTSATVFSAFGGPLDIIDDLRGWFPVGGEWQLKSNIINFDWCARQSGRMVAQCIESNLHKPIPNLPVPVIVTPANGSVLKTRKPVISGTKAMPGAAVHLMEAGVGHTVYGTAVADNLGNWSAIILDHPLKLGNLILTCYQTYNGHTSGYSPTVTFTVIAAPVIISPANGSVVQETTKPLIKGTGGIPGATVRFWEAGLGTLLYGTATVDIWGEWSAIPDHAFRHGNFNLTCDQIFNNHTSDYSPTTTLAIRPFPLIVTPANGSVVQTSKPVISGTNGLPGAAVRFWEAGSGAILYGTAVVDSSGNWSAIPDNALPPGSFPLTCDQVLRDYTSGYSPTTVFTVADDTPQNFQGTAIGNRSVSFTWEPPQRGAGNVIGYVLTIPFSPSAEVSGTSHTLTNQLSALVTYKVKCKFAGGEYSNSSEVKVQVLP